MINANELRIGNYLEPLFIDKPFCIVKGIDEEFVYSDCISTDYTGFDEFKPIILTEEWLLKCGAYQLPHFTVMNTFYFDLGRNRELSIGCVGTPNLMVFIQEIEKDENGKAIKVEDIICVHNWDYDGELYLHQLQNLYFALTQKELFYNPSEEVGNYQVIGTAEMVPTNVLGGDNG